MPNPEQIVCEILDGLEDLLDDMEVSERRDLEHAQQGGLDPNSHGAGVSVGVLEAVQRIREWLNQPRT